MRRVATSLRLRYKNPGEGIRPQIRELIEALARDAVAREERQRGQQCKKEQTEER
jgi:hypothetical protein